MCQKYIHYDDEDNNDFYSDDYAKLDLLCLNIGVRDLLCI